MNVYNVNRETNCSPLRTKYRFRICGLCNSSLNNFTIGNFGATDITAHFVLTKINVGKTTCYNFLKFLTSTEIICFVKNFEVNRVRCIQNFKTRLIGADISITEVEVWMGYGSLLNIMATSEKSPRSSCCMN